MNKFVASLVLCGFASVSLSGCMDSLEKQVEKDPNGIIGKKTKEIGKLDPNKKDQKIMKDDPEIQVSNPITAGLEVYGPALEKIYKLHVKHAIDLYKAEHDRYPRDYDEFMTDIIEANNIELPVLPGGLKYMYDEENHKLVVVKDVGEEPKKE
ncbi:MAG: hypothetical protein KDA68_03480 [Planctomycetaceae bacterium]|nr:hypothetical protein [Planctomycetaceae bacterium]